MFLSVDLLSRPDFVNARDQVQVLHSEGFAAFVVLSLNQRKAGAPEENNNQKNSTAKWNKKEVNIEKQKNNKICLVHSESINILANDAGAHCSGVSGVDARRSGSDRKGDIWGNFVGDWATIWMTEQIRCYKTFFFYLFLIIYLKNLRQRVDGLSRVVLAKSFL